MAKRKDLFKKVREIGMGSRHLLPMFEEPIKHKKIPNPVVPSLPKLGDIERESPVRTFNIPPADVSGPKGMGSRQKEQREFAPTTKTVVRKYKKVKFNPFRKGKTKFSSY